MSVWIMDIETLSNCFTYSAINRDTEEVVSFVIWKNRNDLSEFLDHLDSCKGQIGFNSLSFDYPVIHFILTNRDKLVEYNGDKIARRIYKEAQKTIEKNWSRIWSPLIPQLDLFTIHHFDNKARMTSLKKLEIALGFENVQDMPYHHSDDIERDEQIEEILAYNINDIKATKLFYTKTIDKINLRKELHKKYGLECLNYSDSKIGEELVLKLYCEATGKNPYQTKKFGRTIRKSFKFIQCIPDYVKFSTPEFNGLLDYLKGIEVSGTELKNSFYYEFEYRNIAFDLGTGGIHACTKEGLYESNENEMIVDCDVSGMYPSIAAVNRYYPEHLGEEFCDVYENDIIKPRLEAKKNGNKILADGFKLSANSVYGKSNSEYSFLFDALYTLKTTLTGQLSLCMLSEMLFVGIPELKMLQANTDGVTVIIPRKDKRKYWEICKEWERITKLGLEYIAYDKMIIRDVNNYMAISIDGEVKRKGAFRLHEEMKKYDEWHKAFNQGIVPIALSKYFLEGIAVEETVKNHKNIYDFCKTFNATHGWKCESLDFDEDRNEIDSKEEQKTNRYYIAKNGRKFRKTKDERIIDIEADDLVKIFNKYLELPFEDYEVDYDYYIEECNKIIDKITGEQERRIKEAKQKRLNEKLQREERNFIQYCINKIPTQRQYDEYKRDWLIEKYGEPKEIKPSKTKRKDDDGESTSVANG